MYVEWRKLNCRAPAPTMAVNASTQMNCVQLLTAPRNANTWARLFIVALHDEKPAWPNRRPDSLGDAIFPGYRIEGIYSPMRSGLDAKERTRHTKVLMVAIRGIRVDHERNAPSCNTSHSTCSEIAKSSCANAIQSLLLQTNAALSDPLIICQPGLQKHCALPCDTHS